MESQRISIIVPTLNEAGAIVQTLATAHASSDVEIIVVDGGSQDGTVELVASLGVKVIRFSETPYAIASASRAHQMNAGAAFATGDILLFLHADTHLPADFDQSVRQTLAQPKTIAGAFELRIDAPLIGLRVIEKMVNWRSRYLQMPYGDQAIFLKADIFHRIGRFPEMPIMEDFELIRRLRQWGRISIVPASVLTSGRRWQALGVWRTTLINQITIVAYYLGFLRLELPAGIDAIAASVEIAKPIKF